MGSDSQTIFVLWVRSSQRQPWRMHRRGPLNMLELRAAGLSLECPGASVVVLPHGERPVQQGNDCHVDGNEWIK